MATSNFLVPNGTFIVELIGFLIVLGVVGRYLLPPINRALRERQARIGQELAAADQARADAAAAEDERRAELEEARRRAREIVEQANRSADKTRGDATAQAQEEHDRILANAAAEVAQARQRAIEDAAAQMGQIVMDVAERVVGREIDADAHRDLVNEAIAAINADGASGGTTV